MSTGLDLTLLLFVCSERQPLQVLRAYFMDACMHSSAQIYSAAACRYAIGCILPLSVRLSSVLLPARDLPACTIQYTAFLSSISPVPLHGDHTRGRHFVTPSHVDDPWRHRLMQPADVAHWHGIIGTTPPLPPLSLCLSCTPLFPFSLLPQSPHYCLWLRSCHLWPF